MAGRKGGKGGTALDELESEADGVSEAEVSVTGKGSSVPEALRKAGLGKSAKDLKGKLGDQLKDPANKISCSRIFPTTMRGPGGKSIECADVVSLPTPMTLEEIKDHLRAEYGGKKWNIRVLDEDGEVLNARNEDIPGEPKYRPSDADQFEMPDLDSLGDEGGGPSEEIDPLDREIAEKEKTSRILALEKQNARLKSEIDELNGGGKKDNGEVDVAKLVEDALAKQAATHKAEMDSLKEKQDRDERERRHQDELKAVREENSKQIEALKKTIEDQGASKSAAKDGELKDITHRLDMMQRDNETKLKETLAAYEKGTSAQINALEKTFMGQVSQISNALQALQSRPAENPIKEVVPLLTSSIERSTAGYKEVIAPLMAHVASGGGREEPRNDLRDTLETMQTFGVIPGANKDLGARVFDFADKMAPEVFDLIKKKQEAGERITEDAVKNHLKLVATKMEKEVVAAARDEIRKIKSVQAPAPQGLPAPAPAAAAPAPAPAAPPRPAGPSPIGRISPEEQAERERRAAESRRTQEPDEEEEERPTTPEEEMADRVNATLELLEKEMKVRPRKLEWPEFAWDNLPGQVLDQIVYANDEEDVYNAIKPFADAALADRIWELVRADAKCKDFIVNGINMIKAWAVELQEKQKELAEKHRAAQEQAQGGGQAPAAPQA